MLLPMSGPKGTRPARPITPRRLENMALAYLQRFSSSRENLRRVLLRRVRVAIARGWDGDAAAAAVWAEAVVERMTGLGYLDDAAYAGARARTLHRRGRPLKVIRADLAARGVGEGDIEAAVAALAAEAPATDLRAALAFARRRRLGPFRASAEERAACERRDMAALARAGFSYDQARRVLEAPTPDEVAADGD